MANQESSSSTSDRRSNITSHLHNHLTALRSLREGFIEQHGAEPSVSFRYSQQSTSNSTICLRVVNQGNNNNQQDAANVPSTSESNSGGDNNSNESVPAVEQMVRNVEVKCMVTVL